MDKIIITTEDVDKIESPDEAVPIKRQVIPIWWRLLTSMLVLIPPLLFIISIVGLIAVRRKELSIRYVYTFHYCCLLLAGALLWTLFGLWLMLRVPDRLPKSAFYKEGISFSATPQVPSINALSGKDIAKELSSAVIIVHQTGIKETELNDTISGAGVIVFASQTGCLIATNRHIIDAVSRNYKTNQVVEISLQDGQNALAKVIGIHQMLDLAILWVRQEERVTEFIQSIRQYNAIEIGEPIFVIGHPEGLEFSISSGLVSQKRGDELIQISAPVSPGNSGGPVYDSHGRLVGIIQSVLDKTKLPNAENLNFAVRADVLLNSEKWTLTEEGKLAISTLKLASAKVKIFDSSTDK